MNWKFLTVSECFFGGEQIACSVFFSPENSQFAAVKNNAVRLVRVNKKTVTFCNRQLKWSELESSAEQPFIATDNP